MNENERIVPTPEESGEESNTENTMSQVPQPNEQTPAEENPPTEVESAPVYRWTFSEQAAHERRVKKKYPKGLMVYAAVITGIFLASFSFFIALLAMDNGGGYVGSGIIRPGISNPADDSEAVEGVEQVKHSVVVIEVKTSNGGGTGTGIIMTQDGYIATNHHVIEGATKIKVTFYDGTVMSAEFIGSSEMDDLGVIKVNARGLPAATFADSNNCYVGQTVYAIGTPAGPDFGWTTTKGIISYMYRAVKMYVDDDGTLQKKLRLLQMDANVNPGNSGGPLVNTKGEVVGVVSMKLADGYEGIGFAIPSDGAIEILEAIIQHGNADNINSSLSHKRPMLGITGVYVESGAYYLPTADGVQLIFEDELKNYSMDDLIHPAVSGIYVMGFSEGMDAAGKMQIGDIITAVEGEELESMNQLMNVINEFYAGDTVTLTVYRNETNVSVDIILSPKPDQ